MTARERNFAQRIVACGAAVIVLGLTLRVQAALDITAIITADNHYAFFTGDEAGLALSFIGRNEVGVLGSSGGYNWSHAETFTVQDTDDTYVYVATWSDDWIAQGFLGEFSLGDAPLLTGDDGWEVYAVMEDLDTWDTEPGEADAAAHIAAATAGNLWADVFVGGNNGTIPWGRIPEIDAEAQWIWNGAYFNFPDWVHWLFRGGFIGYNPVEYLIFRHQVIQEKREEPIPEPVASVVLLAGSMLVFRRRRLVCKARGPRP